jgi:pimeloyl-ACP methyl ester carboxylesterase
MDAHGAPPGPIDWKHGSVIENSTADANGAREEFSYLAGQAERLGVPVPAAERLHLTLADGRVLSAVRLGRGRPRIVLLHGAGLNAHTWDATSLALRVPALAIDLPGHGDSSWRTDADYRPRTLAPDVVRGIEEWADAPVVLVGHSLGGLTAAAVAASRPELVQALELVDITPGAAGGGGSAELRRFYEETVFPSRDAAVERAVVFGLGGSLEDARRGVLHNTRVRDDGLVEWKHHFARLAQQALSAPADAAADASAPLVDATGWDDLADVAAPIELVRGTRGFVDDAAVADFSRRLPRVRVVTLDAPHNVQEVAPVDLAALIAARGAAPDASAPHHADDSLPPNHASAALGDDALDPTADRP